MGPRDPTRLNRGTHQERAQGPLGCRLPAHGAPLTQSPALSSTPLVLGLGCASLSLPRGRLCQELKDPLHLPHQTLLFFLRTFLLQKFRGSPPRGTRLLGPEACLQGTHHISHFFQEEPGTSALNHRPELAYDVASLINTSPSLINRHFASFARDYCTFLFIKRQAGRVASRRITQTAHVYTAARFCQALL